MDVAAEQLGLATQGVLAVGDGFEVGRVHAAACPATVVEQQPFRYRANECFVGQPVGGFFDAIDEQSAVAVAVGPADPHPALPHRGEDKNWDDSIQDLLDQCFIVGVGLHGSLSGEDGHDCHDLGDHKGHAGDLVLVLGPERFHVGHQALHHRRAVVAEAGVPMDLTTRW